MLVAWRTFQKNTLEILTQKAENLDSASTDGCLRTSMCQRHSFVQSGDVSLQSDDCTKEAISVVVHEFSAAERNTTDSLFSNCEMEMTAPTGPPKKVAKTRRKLKSGKWAKERICRV